MKKIFTILLFLSLAAGLGLFFLGVDRTRSNVLPIGQNKEETNLKIASQDIQATLEVGDSSYTISLPQGSSVYDLMEALRLASLAQDKQPSFQFSGRNFPGLGFLLDEINGVKASQKDGKYWIYYINGQEAQVGISSYIIKPNDIILWKYEKQE